MTKVEELRETIVACVADSKAILSRQVAEQFVDSLISAAEAQGEAKGRAEGAEQEAAKVVHCGECASAKPYPDEPMVECRFGCDRPIDGFCSLGTLFAPATKDEVKP